MKIIDSHVHIGLNKFCVKEERTLPYDLENSYDDYLNVMEKAGVQQACILPIPDDGYDIKLSNDYLSEAVLHAERKFIPICRFDNSLSENINGVFSGAKYHKVYEKISKATLYEYLKILEYYKKPLIIHAAFNDKVKQIKNLLNVAPELVIVLAHMGRGHLYTSERVEENLSALKKYPNVLFETSTVGNSDTVKLACDIVGSERVMFGSDYPFGKIYMGNNYNYADEIDVVLHAKITDTEKENILYRTAERTFLRTNTCQCNENLFITQYIPKYKEVFNQMLSSLSKQDKDFLALDNKIDVIKDCMRKERHIYVIICNGKFAGYFRESGRPNGYSLLEEVVLLPEFRGRGLSKEIISFYKNIYPCNLAKTNGKNIVMNRLLETEGYICISGNRILNWEFNGGTK